MTQKVKIQTTDNQGVMFVLKDDGRVFCEGTEISASSVVSKVNLAMIVLFVITQIEIATVVILNILGVV